MFINEKVQNDAISSLTELHGETHRNRITSGIKQAAALWTVNDGSPEEFKDFCTTQFIADPDILDETFQRLDRIFE